MKNQFKGVYLKIPEASDIKMVDEYANEYKKLFPNYKGVDQNNYLYKLKEFENRRNAIGTNGLVNIHMWLINNNKIIGHCTYNPELGNNEEMKKFGGNISYAIHPKYRGQGYGTLACHLLIKKCLEAGLSEVMITCLDWNIPSKKVITNNFGILMDEIYDNNKKHCRYIVKTKESINKFLKKYNINE